MAMNDFPMDCETFYQIRKVYRMPMKQFAEVLGISTGYVNHIEKSREPLTDAVRLRLIKVFDLTPEKVTEIRRIYEDYRKIG